MTDLNINNLAEATKQLLLKQAKFDLIESAVLGCLFAVISYYSIRFIYRMYKNNRAPFDDDDTVLDVGKFIAAAFGLLVAPVLTLVSLDSFINLLYNPIYVELQQLIAKGGR